MKRNEFLKLTGLGVMALTFYNCSNEQKIPLKNWAGNFEFSSTEVLKPSNLEELLKAYQSDNPLKSLGTAIVLIGLQIPNTCIFQQRI